jgi:hypothetical protein
MSSQANVLFFISRGEAPGTGWEQMAFMSTVLEVHKLDVLITFVVTSQYLLMKEDKNAKTVTVSTGDLMTSLWQNRAEQDVTVITSLCALF